MSDIGVVQYSKNTNNNIIDAKWHYLKNGEKKSGTGIVKGKFDKTFAGDFQVTYYNQEGIETTNFQLKIEIEGEQYHLKWIKDGNIEYFGIGIEYNNILFAGWRKYIE